MRDAYACYDVQIEYNVSYIYHAMYAYFERDNVALPGLAKYFKDASVEEREHAEMFMDYQVPRPGPFAPVSALRWR
jgi:ferritin heavy chain